VTLVKQYVPLFVDQDIQDFRASLGRIVSEEGASALDAVDTTGRNALMWSAIGWGRGWIRRTEILLEMGAKPSLTLLSIAVEKCYVGVIKMLLSSPVCPDVRSGGGWLLKKAIAYNVWAYPNYPDGMPAPRQSDKDEMIKLLRVRTDALNRIDAMSRSFREKLYCPGANGALKAQENFIDVLNNNGSK